MLALLLESVVSTQEPPGQNWSQHLTQQVEMGHEPILTLREREEGGEERERGREGGREGEKERGREGGRREGEQREKENERKSSTKLILNLCIPHNGKIWRALILANHSPKHIGEF